MRLRERRKPPGPAPGTSWERLEPASTAAVSGGAIQAILATPIRRALLIALAWRVLVALVSFASYYLMPRGTLQSYSPIFAREWPASPVSVLLDTAVRLDSGWYASVALNGYTYSTHHLSSIAFYPLYPLLIRIVLPVAANVWIAGVALSNAALFGAVYYLVRWLELRGLDDRAELVTVLILCYPFSFFLGAMYSEPLYLMLALAAFYYAELGAGRRSAFAGGLLALTRPTGIIILPCLAIMAMCRRWRGKAFLALAGPPAGLLAFSLYQLVVFGTPLASTHAELAAPWSRTLGQGWSDLTLHGSHTRPIPYLIAMLALGILFLTAVPAVYRRLGPAYASFAALSILLPASTGLISLERFAAVDFPVFAVVGLLRSRLWLAGLIFLQFYLLLFFTAAFVASWGIF